MRARGLAVCIRGRKMAPPYPTTAIENLKAYFDMRGLVLNILPVALLAGTALFSWRYLKQPFAGDLFRPIDVLVIVGLLLVALVATLDYQVGRIAMLRPRSMSCLPARL